MNTPQPLATFDALPGSDTLIDTLSHDLSAHLVQKGVTDPLMIGIKTGGFCIAQTLHQRLGLTEPLSALDIGFYRDDFAPKGLHPTIGGSDIKSAIDHRDILLVDDVLMTGRTIRAAMNEVFDYGRPKSITLVCLIDIGQRELPISADICAARLNLKPNQRIKLLERDPASFELQLVTL